MIMNETNFSVGEEERQAAHHGEDPGEGMDGRREVGGRLRLPSFLCVLQQVGWVTDSQMLLTDAAVGCSKFVQLELSAPRS